MATITNSEAALLILLSEGPAHPYQIEKLIHDRSMNEWTELSRSTIYKTLAKLEAKGLATSDASLTENNVGRKTYTLSGEGNSAIKAALLGFLSEPERQVWRIDLATSHLGLLDPGEAARALSLYAIELKSLIEGYARLDAYLIDGGYEKSALALARRTGALYRAELEWLEGYIRDLGLDAEGEAR